MLKPGVGRAPPSVQAADTIGVQLTQSARGDMDAFERVYDAVAPSVLGLATGILQNRAVAEEVTHDVLIEIWRTAARYDPQRGTAMTWIMTLTHHRAVDRVRYERAAVARGGTYANRQRPDRGDAIGETVESRLNTLQLRRSLRTLPERQRQAIGLAYFGGYTCREVAQILEVPLGTAKSRIHDGLLQLRDDFAS